MQVNQDDPGNPPVGTGPIVRRSDTPQITVHSWMRDGTMQSAWPGQGKQLPYDATEIKVRLIAFPCGSVREIWLDKGARTHPHGSYETVLFYQISGRRVQMVNEDSQQVDPGDASFQPHGVEHSTHQLIAGLFVEFAMPAPKRDDPQGSWMLAKDVPLIEMAEWTLGEDVIQAPVEADTPADARRYARRVYDFPGYAMTETLLPAGTALAPRADGRDRMAYVVSGRILLSLRGPSEDAKTGDSLYISAGTLCGIAALEDTILIETTPPAEI